MVSPAPARQPAPLPAQQQPAAVQQPAQQPSGTLPYVLAGLHNRVELLRRTVSGKMAILNHVILRYSYFIDLKIFMLSIKNDVIAMC